VRSILLEVYDKIKKTTLKDNLETNMKSYLDSILLLILNKNTKI